MLIEYFHKSVKVPESLADALNEIDWKKVPAKDVRTLISFGIPFLKLKGYLKQTEENKLNEHTKKNSP